MKRKDVDEVNDGLIDFTLSSPALKIRRLDADIVPITDGQDSGNPVPFGQSMPFQDAFVEQSLEGSPIAFDELSCRGVPGNEERAIVLFNPQNNPPSLHSPRPFYLSVDSDFLSAFKNPVIWSNGLDASESLVDETQKQHDNSELGNGCLAVVPWVPSHSQHSPTQDVETPGAHISEMMDTDAMDVEDNHNIQQMPNYHHVTSSVTEGFFERQSVTEGLNQWQQHCMIQQPPSNLSTPITWFGRSA